MSRHNVALPRNSVGRFVSHHCPSCGNGTLFLEGDIWRCDGLEDPNDKNLALKNCEFIIFGSLV